MAASTSTPRNGRAWDWVLRGFVFPTTLIILGAVGNNTLVSRGNAQDVQTLKEQEARHRDLCDKVAELVRKHDVRLAVTEGNWGSLQENMRELKAEVKVANDRLQKIETKVNGG